MKTTKKTHEVILAYNGPHVAYNDAEFSGTEEQCREYIRKVLRSYRRIQGQQHNGTFLAIRDAKTYEWVR